MYVRVIARQISDILRHSAIVVQCFHSISKTSQDVATQEVTYTVKMVICH